MDFIMNGQGHGSVAQQLAAHGYNPGALRPYSLPTGRIVNGVPEYEGTYIMKPNAQGIYVPTRTSNAVATMRKDDWILLDRAIVQAARPRLKLVAALRAAGLVFNIPNGMGTTVLQTQTISDISDAEISMNGVRQSRKDRPVFDIGNLPLPIVHKDFSLYLRELQVSRNGGSPLDTTTAELAGRKVAEQIERLAVGNYGNYTYGGGTIQGLINYSDRITHTITDPTTTSWTPEQLVTEVLAMRQKATDQYHYGPFMLFLATGWDAYLDQDYSDAKGDITLRERLAKITNISVVETLDYLSDYAVVLVQATTDVIREVIGMEVTTLQWESHGGMELNFKVMGIQVPQIRSDQNGNTGIVHGSPA